MKSECIVYHKYIEGMDINNEGYVGVSKNYEKRMHQHNMTAYVKEEGYVVHKAMRKYAFDIKTKIVFNGSIQECYDEEERLRPRFRMGWNLAKGGGSVGSGFKFSENWLDNELINPIHGYRTISANYTPQHMAAEFNMYANDITNTLSGRYPKKNGWEFANKQLAMKCQSKYEKEWTHTYLKNNNIIISIYKTGRKKFVKYMGSEYKHLNIKQVVNNTRYKEKGWKLATEEEWLATKERIEFK